MRLPLITEAYDSCTGERVSFIGDSLEHAPRIGSSNEEFRQMAGVDSLLPEISGCERIRGSFRVLHDANRPTGEKVIGGAVAQVVQRTNNHAFEIHVSAVNVRKKCRGRGIANYALSYVVFSTLDSVPATRLVLPRSDMPDAEQDVMLHEKGFRVTEDGSLALELPGKVLPYIDDSNSAELKAKIEKIKWSGVTGGELYRDGAHVGSVKETAKHAKICDQDGAELTRWNKEAVTSREDFDVNWVLSGALWLLNCRPDKAA